VVDPDATWWAGGQDLRRAATALVDRYAAWDRVEPGGTAAAKADEWRRRVDELR